jgi:hypothetical protein
MLTQKDQLTEFLNLFNNLISNLDNWELILGGDLNLDVLNYQSCNNVSSYIDSLFANGHIQTITKPTRCTISSATCLDHFITNCSQPVYDSVIVVSKISDHFPIIFLKDSGKQQKQHGTFSKIRNFSELNIQNFTEQLNHLSWNHVISESDPEEAFSQFSNTFKLNYDNYFSPRTIRFNKNVHKKQKWMTNGLLISRNRKLCLAKLCPSDPSQHNITMYTVKCIATTIINLFVPVKNFTMQKF